MEKTFKYSFEEVFGQCKKALNRLNININYSSKSDGLIQASTKGSILSWGEDIEIKVKFIENKLTKVIVESNATAQLFSWGKDSTNERNIIEAISANFDK